MKQDSEHEDMPAARSTKKEVKIDDGQDQGLGTVQISVTAATPMVEDADKSFLNDIIKEEEEEDEDDEEINLNEQQTSKNADHLKRDKQLEEDVAEAVDEILEEARIETSKHRPQPKKTKTLDKSDSKDDPAVATKVVAVTAPPPPPPPPAVPPPPPPHPQAPAAKSSTSDLPKSKQNKCHFHHFPEMHINFFLSIFSLPRQLEQI